MDWNGGGVEKEKKPWFFSVGGFLYGTGTDAARAYPQALRLSLHDGMNLLEIGKPAPFAHVVGMTDLVSGCRSFSADVANSRHGCPQ